MPLNTTPEWQQLVLYAVIAAVVIVVLQRLPVVGRIVRVLFSIALLAFLIFVVLQQAPYQPELARITQRLGIDDQRVVGNELRVSMAADGHFWVNATINGVERRMLIDSGATVTALSQSTTEAAGVDKDLTFASVILRTANGTAPARTGSVDELRVGNIIARNLKVVTAAGLGNTDVIGMNFLSQLASWRVEGRTLVLVPHHPQQEGRP
jgi:aspartyl protease family protein